MKGDAMDDKEFKAIRERAREWLKQDCDSGNDKPDLLNVMAGFALSEISRHRNGQGERCANGPVLFYGSEFYVLSNFSSFRIYWRGLDFATSEAAYHFEKFPREPIIQHCIISARSAHDAFKIAEKHRDSRRKDWDEVKMDIMRGIIRAKAQQHEYVRRKLLETGDRELIEDSWRDDLWGWGPNKDGQNWLGKLWMEVRAELRCAMDRDGGERGESE